MTIIKIKFQLIMMLCTEFRSNNYRLKKYNNHLYEKWFHCAKTITISTPIFMKINDFIHILFYLFIYTFLCIVSSYL